MPRAYSMDLRKRVVSAVNDEGLSRHAAAYRFGVAPSTAIKWVMWTKETGSPAPKRMGGYNRAYYQAPIEIGFWSVLKQLSRYAVWSANWLNAMFASTIDPFGGSSTQRG